MVATFASMCLISHYSYLLAHPAMNLKNVLEISLKVTTNIILMESTGMMCPISWYWRLV